MPKEVANTRASLFLLWQHMVFANRVKDHEATWGLLQKQFSQSQYQII